MTLKISSENIKRAVNLDSKLRGKFTASQMRDVIHTIANLPDLPEKQKYHYLFLVDKFEVNRAYEVAKQRGMTLGSLVEKELKKTLENDTKSIEN